MRCGHLKSRLNAIAEQAWFVGAAVMIGVVTEHRVVFEGVAPPIGRRISNQNQGLIPVVKRRLIEG